MKRLTACCAALACGFAIAPAAAVDFRNLTTRQFEELKNMKPRTLPSWVFQPGCTLYEHPNAGGRSWRFRVDSKAVFANGAEIEYSMKNLPASALGKVSSARCDWEAGKRECSAMLYLKPNHIGASAFVRNGFLNLTPEYDDKIVSIGVSCGRL